jgi:hypothetical protein
MRRTKLLVALLLIAAGVLSLGPAPAFAERPLCPNGFFPAPAFIDPQVDRNGNFLICVRELNGEGGNSNAEGFVVIDDSGAFP